MTRSLIFSIVETRPNIAFAMSVTNRFTKNPSHIHTKAVKIILKYLKEIKDRDIVYGQNTLAIERYSDFDWTRDKDSRKSSSNYIFILNSGLMSWYSKCQATVMLSLIEAK